MPGSVEGTGGTIMNKRDLAPALVKAVHVEEAKQLMHTCVHIY